jgi:DNA helicase II / ATP-dependent DNA helicase PcrA
VTSPPPLRTPSELRDLLRRSLSSPGATAFDLTDEQLAAATAPLRPGVIVAGAGSGKTSVMAARVVWLIGSGAVAPDQILGLTFTNKAAGELAERVRRTVHASLGSDPAAGEPTVATYHAYAARLLRDQGLLIGVEPSSRLLPDAARYQLAERVVLRTRRPLAEVTAHTPTTARALLALDSELNEHLISPEELIAENELILAELVGLPRLTRDLEKVAATARKRTELAGLVTELRAAKVDRDRLDFGDQMAAAARLVLAQPAVATAERDRYRVVLLDEFQDTSITQKRLLLALFGDGHPVTAVGDPCQAIYGWRGASVRNIDVFATDFAVGGTPADRYSLTVNNRSGERLLDLANLLAEPLRERHRIDRLRPRADMLGRGEARCALLASHGDEVAWVVDAVAEQIGSGIAAKEVAILVRRRSDFAPYYRALTAAGIAVEVVGLGGLLAVPAVADVVATLRVLDDPTANSALVRLLAGPRWRIGPRDLALLGRRAADLVRGRTDTADARSTPADIGEALADAVAGVDPVDVASLFDALRSPGAGPYSAAARNRFAAAATEYAALRGHAAEPLLDLIHRVIEAAGLRVELAATAGGDRSGRGDALEAFIDAAGAFDDLDGAGGLHAFLGYLDAAEEYENGLDSATPSEADSVKLLTVHKAKGLEWEVVVLPSLSVGVFPDAKSREPWTTSAATVPFRLRGDADDFPSTPPWTADGLAQFRDRLRELASVEELRLGYVAVTRARRLLIASGHWWGPSQAKPRGPSVYLELIRQHCAEGGGTVAHWADAPPEDRNPALSEAGSVSWPVPLDPQRHAARVDSAERVRAAMAVRADGAAGTDPVVAGALNADGQQLAERWDADIELLLAEAAQTHRGDRAVTLPPALAASAVLRVLEDPARFAVDLVRPMPRPPAPAALRGTRFHRWVETRFDALALLDPDDVDGAADADLSDADLSALQQAFLRGPFADRRPHAVEAPFRLVLGDLVISGRIDAVYDDGDGRWLVVDWKTGRGRPDPTQLALYRLAWAELTGVDPSAVDAVFYAVADAEQIRPETLDDREALLARITAATAPR